MPVVSTCLAGLAEFERYAVKSGPAAARARGVVLGVAQWSSDKKAKRVLFTHHGLSYRLIGRDRGLSNNTFMEIVRRQTHKNQIPGFRSRRFSCRDAFPFGDSSSEEVAPIVLVATRPSVHWMARAEQLQASPR